MGGVKSGPSRKSLMRRRNLAVLGGCRCIKVRAWPPVPRPPAARMRIRADAGRVRCGCPRLPLWVALSRVERLDLLRGPGALGAEIANGSGQTALHGAAVMGADVIIQLLAGKGVSLDATDKQGRTALNIAEGTWISGSYVVHKSTAELLGKIGCYCQIWPMTLKKEVPLTSRVTDGGVCALPTENRRPQRSLDISKTKDGLRNIRRLP